MKEGSKVKKQPVKLAAFVTVFTLLCSAVPAQQQNQSSAAVDNLENIRGLVKPSQRAILFSEITGQILEVGFRSGQRFKKGDALIKFDCALYEADLASASAKFEADKKQFENNQKLLALNAISDIEVELSRAQMHISEAEANMKGIVKNNCVIAAPYDGRVVEIKTNPYESVTTGQELISILDDRTMEIDLIVPSRWLTTLHEKAEFKFLVDETGKRYSARITQIGAIVDPVSQTVRLTGEFIDNTDDVLSGMSGTAFFEVE